MRKSNSQQSKKERDYYDIYQLIPATGKKVHPKGWKLYLLDSDLREMLIFKILHTSREKKRHCVVYFKEIVLDVSNRQSFKLSFADDCWTEEES